jgi:hypothetical protein
MARAFDNRNFIQGKQQTFHSVDSAKLNHLPTSYEEPIGNHEKQKLGIGKIVFN